jgi:hypothetical protein
MTTRTAPISVRDLLLIGHPGELLPADQPWARSEAQRFIADQSQPETARRRVLEVWIEGTYRPAWDARPAR